MKITIPSDWVIGRWWQNRILYLIWFFGAVVLAANWFQHHGPLRPYFIPYFIWATACATGFAFVDWCSRRRDASHRYQLPEEK